VHGISLSITLEHPRPDTLNPFVDWLGERVRGN
jgi:hypothetical protein